MNAPSVPIDNPSSLAQVCVDHLNQEQDFWMQVVEVLRGIHRALTSGAWQALADAIPAQEQLAAESDRLRFARRRVREAVGAELGLAADAVTLEHMARRLPGIDARQFGLLRDNLRSSAGEAQRLGQACAILARCHVDFVQRFFLELTGCAGAGRYGPQGTLRPAACRPLVQARG